MKKVWTILKTHFLEDFSWPYYLTLAAFLATGIILNHLFHIEARIDMYPSRPTRIVQYCILYGGTYFIAVLIMVYFKNQRAVLKNRSFWLLGCSGLLIFAVDSGFPYLSRIMTWLDVDISLYTWVYAIMVNGISLFVVGIPLILVYWLLEESRADKFGLRWKAYDPRPYFIMLLIMAPLIAAASFIPEFVNFYPTYRSSGAGQALGVPNWVPAVIYEFFYGTDFFNLELIVRGFLVIGMSRVLGKHAIVPMVVLYCFVHFGKPVGEQISSIVGGYILGVIAFYTRGIWGGVIIHVGIAWMMELAAYLQRTYNPH